MVVLKMVSHHWRFSDFGLVEAGEGADTFKVADFISAAVN